MNKRVIVSIVITVFLLIAIQGVFACITPTGPTVINSSDSICTGVYNFTGNALAAGSPNIIVDCNSSIFVGTNNGTGLTINVSNVEFYGCHFTNFSNGADISSTTNITLNDTLIENSSNIGLNLFSVSNSVFESIIINSTVSDGIFVQNSGFNNTFNFLQIQNTAVRGIVLSNVGSANIFKNSIIKNATLGVLATTSDDVRFINMTISDATDGIRTSGSSDNITISNSTVFNTVDAIDIDSGFGPNFILGNTLYNNTNGVFLDFTPNATVSGNTIFNNTKGIFIDQSVARNNSIFNNSIFNNTIGLHITSENNTIADNNFENNGVGVNITGANNFVFTNNFTNNSIQASSAFSSNLFYTNDSGSEQGNFWQDIFDLSLNISDANFDGFGDTGSAYPYNSGNGGTVLGLVVDYGPILNFSLATPVAPNHSAPVLISSNGTNSSDENLTLLNQSTTHSQGKAVKNIYEFLVNGSSIYEYILDFEAGSNSTFTPDYTENGMFGNVSGPAYNKTGGYDGFGAYEFGGFDFINVSNSVGINESGDFTISLWYKIKNSSKNHRFFYAVDSLARNLSIVFEAGNVSARIVGGGVSTLSGLQPSATNWSHVALTHSNGTYSLFNNGVLASNLTTLSVDVSGSHVIGGDLFGSLDDVVMYNRSLSSAAIAGIYNNLTNTLTSDQVAPFDVWQGCVTPVDFQLNGSRLCSNNLTIVDANDFDGDGDPNPTDCAPLDNSTFSPRADLQLQGGNFTFCSGTYYIPLNISSNTIRVLGQPSANASLNCNGATLIGNGTGNGLASFYSTVSNCNIYNFSKGLVLESTGLFAIPAGTQPHRLSNFSLENNTVNVDSSNGAFGVLNNITATNGNIGFFSVASPFNNAVVLNITNSQIVNNDINVHPFGENIFMVIMDSNITTANNYSLLLNGTASAPNQVIFLNTSYDNYLKSKFHELNVSWKARARVQSFNGVGLSNYNVNFTDNVSNIFQTVTNSSGHTPLLNLTEFTGILANFTSYTPYNVTSYGAFPTIYSDNQVLELKNSTLIQEAVFTVNVLFFNETVTDSQGNPAYANFTFVANDNGQVFKAETNASGHYNVTLRSDTLYNLTINATDFDIILNLTNLSTLTELIDYDSNVTRSLINLGDNIQSVKIIGVDSELNGSVGLFTIHTYDTSLIDKLANLFMYKCTDWNFTNQSCIGAFVEQNTFVVGLDRVYISNSDFSGFGLGEIDPPGTTIINNQGGGGGGGGGTFVQAPDIDIDALAGELADLIRKFDVLSTSTDLITKQIYPGETTRTKISIRNILETSVDIQVSFAGDILDLIDAQLYDFTLEVNEDGEVPIIISADLDKVPGLYVGELQFTVAGQIARKIPVEIRVLESREKFLDMNVVPLKAIVEPGSDLDVQVDLFNLGRSGEIDARVIVELIDPDTNNVLSEQQITSKIDTALSRVVTLSVPNGAAFKKYIVKGTALYTFNARDLETSVINWVDVGLPFYKRTFLGFPILWFIWLIGAVLLLAALWWAYYGYVAKKRKKKRFTQLVNLKELPAPIGRTAFVGNIAETNIRTFFNLEDLKTHSILAGNTGSGKTVAAQVMVEEALKHNVAVLVFDPSAQWTGFLRKLKDKKMLKQYKSFGMNKDETQSFSGNVFQVTNPKRIFSLKNYMKPGEITVFSLSSLNPKDIDVVVANTVSQIFRSNLEESTNLKALLVYDEVHRLLPKFGGSGSGFVQLERAVREFRKWGIGLVLISQVMNDFMGEIKANISTEIQMRSRDEADLERVKTKYGQELMKDLIKSSVGSGMVQNSQYNKGRPYMVSFRPVLHQIERLSDKELLKYNEYNDKLADIQNELDQLKENSVETFDLELEYKLAYNKVRAGNFNMANLYLEGLVPRLEKQWVKLGKKPKPRTELIIPEEVLDKDVKKAEAERSKVVKPTVSVEAEVSKLADDLNQLPKPPQKNKSVEEKISNLASELKEEVNTLKKVEKAEVKVDQDVKKVEEEVKKVEKVEENIKEMEDKFPIKKNINLTKVYERLKKRAKSLKKKGKDISAAEMELVFIPTDLQMYGYNKTEKKYEKIYGKLERIKRLLK